MEQANDAVKEIQTLSPWLLLTLVLCALGIILHRIPKYPNWAIPITLIGLGAFTFAMIGPVGVVDPTKFAHPSFVLALQGALFGVVAWAGKDTIVLRLNKFFPDAFPLPVKDTTDKPQDPKPPTP